MTFPSLPKGTTLSTSFGPSKQCGFFLVSDFTTLLRVHRTQMQKQTKTRRNNVDLEMCPHRLFFFFHFKSLRNKLCLISNNSYQWFGTACFQHQFQPADCLQTACMLQERSCACG